MTEEKGNRKYGLLGCNISYSLSPAMHNAAFRHFGMESEYGLFDVEDSGLDRFIWDRVLSGDLSGFNVTVPHKIRMKTLLERCSLLEVSCDKCADITGAANTVKVDGKKVAMFNTDAPGFYDSLKRDAGYDPARGKGFFVVGAGRPRPPVALYLAMMTENVRINVYDVDGERLSELGSVFDRHPDALGRNVFRPLHARGEIPSVMSECDLVVNATPLGTKEGDPVPFPFGGLKEGTTVYDLVYARRTELMMYAEAKGLKALNGLGMLVGQAARAFAIWTGKEIEETGEVMADAAKGALGRI
jgi:shikimate dehydrogenase